MRILLIEDDTKIAHLIQKMLSTKKVTVDIASTGRIGTRQSLKVPYDSIIVDLYLPDLTGHLVAQSIRAHNKHIPIIMLTAESDIKNKLKGLELCDDYLTKPFHMDELLARIFSITRRGKILHNEVLECGDLRMDIKACSVSRSGRLIKLRNKEYILLEFLLRNKDCLVTREDILDHIWDSGVERNTNTIDVHIRMLRKKIDEGFLKKLIVTLPSRGYKITDLRYN